MKKEELTAALKQIGLQEGMSIEVHSSLSSFGHVEGGAETVIDALIECVGESGSIFMPAMRFSPAIALTEEDKTMGITTKIRILPEDAPRTAMGVIADTFRQRRDVITGAGIIRTAGWGRHAEEAAKGGLDYVIHHGGKALLLGVDIYKLTAMHYVEDLLPKEIGDIFAPSEEMRMKYPPEEWLIEAGEPPVKAWYTIQEMACEHGLVKEGYIGCCKYMFFDIWDVVSIYERELETNPLQLYGLA
ncbi:MAG: AAC(3) family N-acetyltransferase [Clostridia bacterium]|nr:AAC(3) family N-acetyltransferase [Clostridia bacterium]